MTLNVFGEELKECSKSPKTGFYRDGSCNTGADDYGMHTVCVVMTEDFLRFSFDQGNDLITPMPQYNFPGLGPGDSWCLCALRWKEAYDAGRAPKVVLEATHENTLEVIPLEDLVSHAHLDS